MKEEHSNKANRLFGNTGVNITVDGRRHLGAVIRQDIFVAKHVDEQVEKWAGQVE